MDHKAQKKNAQAKVAQLLRENQLEAACRTMAKYEAAQSYPRGIGIDWKTYQPGHDLEKLQYIFSATPKILQKYPPELIDSFRLPAAMMLLFGQARASEWLPVEYQIRGKVGEGNTAARMLLFYATQQFNLIQFKRHGIKAVQILSVSNGCENCQARSGQRYPIENVPEIPFHNCTDDRGCRCQMLTI